MGMKVIPRIVFLLPVFLVLSACGDELGLSPSSSETKPEEPPTPVPTEQAEFDAVEDPDARRLLQQIFAADSAAASAASSTSP